MKNLIRLFISVAAIICAANAKILIINNRPPAKNELRNGKGSSSSSSSSSSSEGFQNDLLNQTEAVQLNINTNATAPLEVHPFGFGASGTLAYQTFFFYTPATPSTIVLAVWDCYCPGDRFDAYLNDQYAFSTTSGCSNRTAYSPNSCTPYQADPVGCLTSNVFCVGQQNLTSSRYYNLTIRVAESYYGVGIGYISLFPFGRTLS